MLEQREARASAVPYLASCRQGAELEPALCQDVSHPLSRLDPCPAPQGMVGAVGDLVQVLAEFRDLLRF